MSLEKRNSDTKKSPNAEAPNPPSASHQRLHKNKTSSAVATSHEIAKTKASGTKRNERCDDSARNSLAWITTPGIKPKGVACFSEKSEEVRPMKTILFRTSASLIFAAATFHAGIS